MVTLIRKAPRDRPTHWFTKPLFILCLFTLHIPKYLYSRAYFNSFSEIPRPGPFPLCYNEDT
ncbi:hypothetical protein E2C01_035560 [Portunus trituberculatus]|uniref:Uncharacterized protein n=1 Tax=Portunus trituberculatus TaxID=210409 RepID=A0A5B7F8S6_PORTR|nr:hypothetical protein [Portunus trituberculatus]